jgi:hypothetical protein
VLKVLVPHHEQRFFRHGKILISYATTPDAFRSLSVRNIGERLGNFPCFTHSPQDRAEKIVSSVNQVGSIGVSGREHARSRGNT